MQARDNPLLLGIFIVTAVLVSLFNLVTDIAYSIADPRVELGAMSSPPLLFPARRRDRLCRVRRPSW